MTYARARLWVGITGVGTWVLLSLAGILGQWGALWQSRGIAVDLALWLLAFTVIQAPLDWLGGFYLPARYGRPQTSFAAWLRGTLAMGALWWLGALLLFWAGQRTGVGGALLAMFTWMLLLVVGQEWLARLVSRLIPGGVHGKAVLVAATDPGFSGGWAAGGEWSVRTMTATDPGFSGGWAGLGTTLRLWMPSHWPAEFRDVQIIRRHGVLQSGARARGLLVAVAFNLAGLTVSYSCTPGAGFATTGEYLHLVFGFTLWSFLGLLTLPSLTRPAVHIADQFASRQGVAWQSAARQLDRLQDDEPARSPWLERIFHPIPSLQSRLTASAPSSWGAWQAARLALYLGAAVPGLLARSVHCNAGRPELWVFYPAD